MKISSKGSRKATTVKSSAGVTLPRPWPPAPAPPKSNGKVVIVVPKAK